jgi:hypothetical protein
MGVLEYVKLGKLTIDLASFDRGRGRLTDVYPLAFSRIIAVTHPVSPLERGFPVAFEN